MSAAGSRYSPVSRKRLLGSAHASPAACSCGGELGGSGSPKAKRRLFAAAPGSRSTVAATSAAAEPSSHGGQPCSQFKARALAHKGKATYDVDYNLEDPSSRYNNAIVHSRLSEYTLMARTVHGPESDPSIEDLDGEVVMRVEGGKKHVQYWIGDNTLNTTTTPTFSLIRARSTSSSLAIHPRLDTVQQRIEALQAQLEEEKRLQKARAEAHRQWMEAHRQRMEQIYMWMRSFCERMGHVPPPMLFPSPPPVDTPNESVASNDGPRDQPDSS